MESSPARLKVCHVFAGTQGGRWVVEQLQALRDDHGCDVRAVLGGTSGPTVALCAEAGIPVIAFAFPLSGWRALFAVPWCVLRLAWWMRRERIEVVQSHVIQSTLFARPAAWLADVPVRLTMVTGPFYMQARSSRWMEKATAWMETAVIPSCELIASLYRDSGITTPLAPTLYYGPPADAWDPAATRPAGLRAELGLAEGTPLIGCIAVFYPRCGDSGFYPAEVHNRFAKGHEELIAAMPTVLEEFPEARLVLVGKGWGPQGEQTEQEIRQLVRDAGLEDKVLFAGYRSDIPSVYRDIDVSVQASLNDNLGGTVESLLMARPTVATRVGGMVDAVVDGETGVLVAPGDPADLARGIVSLLRDPQRAARLGAAGRERMLSRFTLATTAAGLATFYRQQRGAAPGAWRLHRSLARLMVAGLLHLPVLGRAMVWDLFLGEAIARKWARLRASLRSPSRSPRPERRRPA